MHKIEYFNTITRGNGSIKVHMCRPTTTYHDLRKKRSQMSSSEKERAQIKECLRGWRRQFDNYTATHIITYHFPFDIQDNIKEMRSAIKDFCTQNDLSCWCLMQGYHTVKELIEIGFKPEDFNLSSWDDFEDEFHTIFEKKMLDDKTSRFHFHGVLFAPNVRAEDICLWWRDFICKRYKRNNIPLLDRTCENAWENMNLWWDYITRFIKVERRILAPKSKLTFTYKWSSIKDSSSHTSLPMTSCRGIQQVTAVFKNKAIYDHTLIQAINQFQRTRDVDSFNDFWDNYDYSINFKEYNPNNKSAICNSTGERTDKVSSENYTISTQSYKDLDNTISDGNSIITNRVKKFPTSLVNKGDSYNNLAILLNKYLSTSGINDPGRYIDKIRSSKRDLYIFMRYILKMVLFILKGYQYLTPYVFMFWIVFRFLACR